MGEQAAAFNRREQPYALVEGERLEIEAKVGLARPVDVARLIRPAGYRVEVRETNRTSEHVFYYDDQDRYLCSITAGQAVKTKTEPQVELVAGVPILVRMEAIKKRQPGEVPPHHRTRRLTRTRSSVWLVQEAGPLRFFVAGDTCVAQDGSRLFQLEVEYAGADLPAAQVEAALAEIARLVTLFQAEATRGGVPFTPHTLAKYDWLKTTQEVSGWRRFFSRG